MSENNNATNIVFPVSALYIQLDTNTGKGGDVNVQLFKRSMIKMPKMDTPPILASEYPFFTKNVRYPSSIERSDWKTKYEFFFNRELFMDRLRKEIGKNPLIYKRRLTSTDESENDELYKWMQETEKHNVMITLRSIFPIPEVFGKTLKNSYEHILKNNSNSRVIWDINIRNAINIFGFMYKFGIANKEKEEYFINIGGKLYEVDDVVWENDLVNHPVYRKFLKSQRETYEEVASSSTEVEEKYLGYLQKLNDDLTNMKLSEQFQTDFFLYSDECKVVNCEKNEKDVYSFLKKFIKTAKKTEIDRFIKGSSKNPNEFNSQTQYLLHKYFFKPYYDFWKEQLNNLDTKNVYKKTHIEKLINSYDKIENFNFNYNNKPKDHEVELDSLWDNEAISVFNLILDDYGEDDDYTESFFEEQLNEYIYNMLKSDTIFMLRMHIILKNETSNVGNSGSFQNYNVNVNNDRKTVVKTITDKFKLLSNETGETAADLIISIKDDLDTHRQLHSNEGISVFMERDYEMLFERLLKVAIEIKASSIVLKFAKNNIPMNLTGKKPDGTDVSPINQRINKYIADFFGTEASINNKLSTNVNNVYEPIRRTSNKELYKVLKLFKLGDAIMKREHKLSNSEIDEYRNVLDNVHSQYISMRQTKTDNVDEYLYTGVDEVKSTAGSGSENKNESEIRRNVQEIYVRLDLVDSELFKNANRASCKLLDKELEQEYMYLVDPRNKKNSSLSRFRNLDFGSVVPNPMISKTESSAENENKKNTDANKVDEKKGGSNRTYKILKSNIRNLHGRKTIRKMV